MCRMDGKLNCGVGLDQFASSRFDCGDDLALQSIRTLVLKKKNKRLVQTTEMSLLRIGE